MKKEVRNALVLGIMCTISYLGCYIARNVLGVVTPELIKQNVFTVEAIGNLSTGFMICYALGQLINGRLGDMIKAKYMVGGGLFLAGLCNIALAVFNTPILIVIIYSTSGFFLSCIYAPIMKAVAENTLPKYASRCTVGFMAASFLGTPIASFIAIFFEWKAIFTICGLSLAILGILCFISFTIFEKKGIIKYNFSKEKGGNKLDYKYLIKNSIIQYTIYAILTGIVRTTVIFWIPTYLAQYLGLSTEMAAIVFTIITLIKSASPYINTLLIYDFILKRNSYITLIVMFAGSTVAFLGMYFVNNAIINVAFLTIALLTSAGAAVMVFSVYCPSYGKSGMASTVTGYLDFASYVGAAIANIVFANAVSDIGWGNLILVWAGLMLIGTLIALPNKKKETI